MRVRLFQTKNNKKNRIGRFLRRNKVSFEMVPMDVATIKGSHVFRAGEVPAVEVDGQLFVDPNEDALKKILRIA